MYQPVRTEARHLRTSMSAQLATGTALRVLQRVGLMIALTTQTVLTDLACALILSGEIDCANADDVATVGVSTVNDPAVKALTIDLNGIRFCDAAGLGALVRIRNAALLQNKTLRLEPRSDAVQKLLRLTALDKVFSIGLLNG